MRILALNSSDNFGGAARAAFRLQGALRDHGADARMLVQRKFSDDPYVIGPANIWQTGLGLARNRIDNLPLNILCRRHNPMFSISFVPSDTVSRVNRLSPDIVHLHWICEGLANIGGLSRIKAPLVWTLHDSWPFTGGCHVPHDCSAYRQKCGYCPELQSSFGLDLSRIGWRRKRCMLNSLQPVIISPSRWLAACAAESSLMHDLRIEVIPNCIDTNCFKPFDKLAARQLLGIDPHKTILLFSALDGVRHRHKGFHLLEQALVECSRVAGFRESTELYVAGCSTPERLPDLPIPVHFLGQLRDNVSIALLNNASDLYLAPALLENFSTTVLEAMACGTPSVAFNAGGMSDLLDHGMNGYLARAYDIQDFARGIIWALDDRERLAVLSKNCCRKVRENFTLDIVAKRHMHLYEELCVISQS